jgi:hypothetical protein
VTPQPPGIVSAVLGRAAANIETATYAGPFQAGPRTWAAVHQAATELVTNAVVEHLHRVLGVRQVQHWTASREECVTALRAAAGEPPATLSSLQNDDAHRQLQEAREILAAALGLPVLDVDTSILHLALDARYQLGALHYQVGPAAARRPVARRDEPAPGGTGEDT